MILRIYDTFKLHSCINFTLSRTAISAAFSSKLGKESPWVVRGAKLDFPLTNATSQVSLLTVVM